MADREEFTKRAIPLINDVYRVALSLREKEDDAMDLVQDTYLKAWRFFDQFTTGTNIKSWLMKILYNTFKNDYKKQHRRKEILANDIDRLAEKEEDKIESKFLENLLDEEIEKSLQEIPAEFREAIILVDIGGMSYEEASKSIGCAIGTVRSRLSRGRNLLRKSLFNLAKERGIVK